MFFDDSDLKTEEIFLKLVRTCDAQPEKQWLPAYYFDICLPDGTKIGHCDLRIGHNEKTRIGGNIGYGIDEPHTGGTASRQKRVCFCSAWPKNMV